MARQQQAKAKDLGRRRGASPRAKDAKADHHKSYLYHLDGISVRHWAVAIMLGGLVLFLTFVAVATYAPVFWMPIFGIVGAALIGLAGYFLGRRKATIASDGVRLSGARALTSFGLLGVIIFFAFWIWIVLIASLFTGTENRVSSELVRRLPVKAKYGKDGWAIEPWQMHDTIDSHNTPGAPEASAAPNAGGKS